MMRQVRRLVVTAGLVAALLGPGLAEDGAAAELAPATGRLLVASPGLSDPRFRQSVILLVQHDGQGSGGVIINRPSRLALKEVLGPEVAGAARAGQLHYGGPVAPRKLLVLLAHGADVPAASQPVMDDIALTGLAEFVAWREEGAQPFEFRVFTGHAGWAPGQLEAEIARGDWRVLPAGQRTVFATDPGSLWEQLRELVIL